MRPERKEEMRLKKKNMCSIETTGENTGLLKKQKKTFFVTTICFKVSFSLHFSCFQGFNTSAAKQKDKPSHNKHGFSHLC